MAIDKILKKLFSKPKERGLNPDETELASYMEEERQKKIRQLVGKFREKKSEEILIGNTLVEHKGGILDAQPILGRNTLIKENKILHDKNLFLR